MTGLLSTFDNLGCISLSSLSDRLSADTTSSWVDGVALKDDCSVREAMALDLVVFVRKGVVSSRLIEK
jgi:hypothetical protein